MSARKKILMLTTQLGYGGAETSFIRLANFLSQSMDVTVALFTSDYGMTSYAKGHEPLHAQIVLLDGASCGRLQRWWRRILRVRKLKAEHDATISFLSGPNLVNVLAGYNAHSIVSLRGSRIYDPVAPKKQRWLFQYLVDPIVYVLAAYIVPVSAGLKNEIRQVVGSSILKKVRVISPFVDSAAITQRLSEPAPEPYASLKGQEVIVAVGRLSVEKGFHHLIRVLSLIHQTRPGVKLLLVGDGPMMHRLRQLCSELGLAIDNFIPGITSVIFTGYQKNPLPLIVLGRVYAMTSSTEGFPSVLLEAMAANVPVIAADTPWGSRAILNNDEGIETRAYPTTAQTQAKYGTLMPRIDTPENYAHWAETLTAQIMHPHIPTAAKQHVLDYELSNVGAKWKALLDAMERP